MRRLLVAVVLATVLFACGDDDGGPVTVAPTTGGPTTTVAPTPVAPTTATPTTPPATTGAPTTAAPTTAVPAAWVLGELPAQSFPACCGEVKVGEVSPPLASTIDALAPGMYAVDIERWDPAAPGELAVRVRRFVPCAEATWCEDPSVEGGIAVDDEGPSVAGTLPLDAEVGAGVHGASCGSVATAGPWLGDGWALQDLLVSLEADYDRFVRGPLSGGASLDEVVTSLQGDPSGGFLGRTCPGPGFQDVMWRTPGGPVTLLFQSLVGPDGPLEPSQLLRPTLLEVSTDGLRLDLYMGYTP